VGLAGGAPGWLGWACWLTVLLLLGLLVLVLLQNLDYVAHQVGQLVVELDLLVVLFDALRQAHLLVREAAGVVAQHPELIVQQPDPAGARAARVGAPSRGLRAPVPAIGARERRPGAPAPYILLLHRLELLREAIRLVLAGRVSEDVLFERSHGPPVRAVPGA
jgi:hypothetical protein